MDSAEFRKQGKNLIDFIADYHDTIAQTRVTSDVEPGYLRQLVPEEPPVEGQEWESIMEDVNTSILPGITHWLHPNFFAYFPIGCSYPSLLGEMLSSGLASNGFSWITSPAITELETIVLDWLGQMMGLPDDFLFFKQGSKGGGVLQSSASECVFLCLVAARDTALKQLKRKMSTTSKKSLLSSLVAYCSAASHTCIEKNAKVALVRLRVLETDSDFQLRGQTVADAIEEDLKNGYHPCFVMATLGTTSCASCDVLSEIGPVCEKYNVWLHVDAAYAGAALICPEFRPFAEGMCYAHSFNMNSSKWMLVNYDCCAMWVKNRLIFIESFLIDAIYLDHDESTSTIDYRNWGLTLSRRFRSLKLWFTIRNFGVAKLQQYIRLHCSLAKMFERFVREDDRFEVINIVWFGLVCFRLKGSNSLNEQLLRAITNSGLIFMIPSTLKSQYVIRFCVTYEHATEAHITNAWEIIKKFASEVLEAGKS